MRSVGHVTLSRYCVIACPDFRMKFVITQWNRKMKLHRLITVQVKNELLHINHGVM